MSGYKLEHVHADYHRIVRNGIKVAIVFPADSNGRLAVYPHPDTYPSLTFDGLPEPLLPEWMTFGSLEQVAAFLGIEPVKEAA